MYFMFDLRLGYKVTLSISHYVNFKLISKIIIWFIHKLHNESVPVCHLRTELSFTCKLQLMFIYMEMKIFFHESYITAA